MDTNIKKINEPKWYILYTMPNYEKKIHNILSRAGYQAYLPIVEEVRQWSDRKKRLQLPLLPNYVFINVLRHKAYETLHLKGIVKLLSGENGPVFLSNDEIETLKKLTDCKPSLITPNMCKGKRFQVINGPLTGLYGLVSESRGKNRLSVRIESLGKCISVDIMKSDIIPVEEKVY